MKKIGNDFKLLAPKSENAVIPIWLDIAKLITKTRRDCDTIFWTTDYLGGTLAVRLIDSTDEDAASRNVMLISTPNIAESMKTMNQILGDRFCDETLRDFRSVYETWVDYVIRISFESSKVQHAFRDILEQHKSLSIISTTIDEGLSGDIRIVWQSKAAKTRTKASIIEKSKRYYQAMRKRKRAIMVRKPKS